MKVTILGCGTSSGVPRIGGDWGACDPANPKNRRSRVSLVVETHATRILIDTAPDMREQLLACELDHLDAVVWTHDHADHCHGIDDLRQLFHRTGKPIAGFARHATRDALQNRFAYIFSGNPHYPAIATMGELADTQIIGDITARVVDQPHGRITSAGLRFEANGVSIVYATDFGEVTDRMRELYAGCDLFIVDALRESPHPTHAHLSMTLELIADVAPGQAVLTHMDKSMDYEKLRRTLPPGVVPAHDGMVVLLPVSPR